ncbi:GH35 family beta-galactosidase [Duganella sp. PWIR1]
MFPSFHQIGAACAVSVALLSWTAAQAAEPPQLRKQGSATQLIVDGQPFLLLGGELRNSSASNLDYLNKQWPTLKAAELNTVLAPVEWDQLEPAEGKFDFTVMDGLLKQARANNTRLVLLWFGAWKNSMSTYAPAWVKRDTRRFPRAVTRAGVAQEILTPFAPATLAADTAAFRAMLAHLKQVDTQRTVLMIQVENEIGMLPEVRDYSAAANEAWRAPVPAALTAYLAANRATLQPGVKAAWETRGARSSGTWAEVFGDTIETEEMFQAWHYAAFVESMTAAGKAVYRLPMYVNVALNRPGKRPGEYPSAGPLPHLFDIWKPGAPSIDVLAIDTYFPNFSYWAKQFKRADNPLFVPEANHAERPDAGADAFYAIGEHDAFGFSPFAIDDIKDGNSSLPQAYRVLRQLAPVINQHQGSGKVRGFKAPLSYDGVVDTAPQQVAMGGYTLNVSFNAPWEKLTPEQVQNRGGLVIQTGEDEFIVAGMGLTVVFGSADGAMVGIEKSVEGSYQNGRWIEGRWMNGDETHQGRHIGLPGSAFTIQRVKLYRYR